jgi:hypothetical protein
MNQIIVTLREQEQQAVNKPAQKGKSHFKNTCSTYFMNKAGRSIFSPAGIHHD